MKRIEVFAQPFELDAIKEAMLGVGIQGITVSETKDFEPSHVRRGLYRGAESPVAYAPMVRLETVVREDRLEPTLRAIADALPDPADAADRIVVMSVEEAVRIRTGESGVRAIR